MINKSQSAMLANLEKENKRLVGENEKLKSFSSISFVKLAENDVIDDVTAFENIDAFLEWEPAVDYKEKEIRSYNGSLYKCLQAHTSQEDWNPEAAASLWKKIGDPTEEFPEWSQPISSVDAYMKDDKVSFGGKHYISTIDNNVWQPTVYGWDEI